MKIEIGDRIRICTYPTHPDDIPQVFTVDDRAIVGPVQ